MISPTLASLLSGRSSPPYSPAIPDLAEFTNPDVPPCPLGWEWCNDMHVWLPADLSPFLDSTRVYRDAAVYPSMRATPRPSRKIARVFSPEFWRKAEKRQQSMPWDEEQRGPIRVERADGWVHVHGVTFSQLDLITVPQAQAMGRAVFPPKYNGSTGHPQHARALVTKTPRSAGKAPRASTPSSEGVMTPTTSTVHPYAPGHLYFLRPPRLGRAAENPLFPSSVGRAARRGREDKPAVKTWLNRRSSREGLITPGNSAAAAVTIHPPSSPSPSLSLSRSCSYRSRRGLTRLAPRLSSPVPDEELNATEARGGKDASGKGQAERGPAHPAPDLTDGDAALVLSHRRPQTLTRPAHRFLGWHRATYTGEAGGTSEGLITPMTSEPPTDSPLFPNAAPQDRPAAWAPDDPARGSRGARGRWVGRREFWIANLGLPPS
ncbi:hypothetical protein SCP_1303250 [Sparassis crispa]|uniref:Uncharacterized protein n=1 Tax=Sparassis crispa TaxID=139825 RepID=A0A401H288_9APHY|nr:hypothetical protein SCP_1303250 [Sparassis crispa]GBE88509.1 hypothetical protein SCP_1303250 [Sparassis crispa]